jgi:hypothetical protein
MSKTALESLSARLRGVPTMAARPGGELGQCANKYLDSLRGELKLPAVGSDAAAPEHACEAA